MTFFGLLEQHRSACRRAAQPAGHRGQRLQCCPVHMVRPSPGLGGTAFAAKTPPLPCVSTAFAAKTVPLYGTSLTCQLGHLPTSTCCHGGRYIAAACCVYSAVLPMTDPETLKKKDRRPFEIGRANPLSNVPRTARTLSDISLSVCPADRLSFLRLFSVFSLFLSVFLAGYPFLFFVLLKQSLRHWNNRSQAVAAKSLRCRGCVPSSRHLNSKTAHQLIQNT